MADTPTFEQARDSYNRALQMGARFRPRSVIQDRAARQERMRQFFQRRMVRSPQIGFKEENQSKVPFGKLLSIPSRFG
jgi:hypothetical protein